MSRVFDGGDGPIRGGIEERSSVSGVPVPFNDGLDAFEGGGDTFPVTILTDWERTRRCEVCLLLE